MKSTMKSAFAFIAVALMIMVAVVPMVGVFTEDSSAETVIVPPGTTTQITVKGTVSDSTSQKIQNALVEVEYGNGYYAYGITNSSGAYEIKVNYKTEDGYVDLRVTVISDENDDQKYKALTGLTTNPAKGRFTQYNNYQVIENVKGDISGIDFMSGMISISGKLLYANKSSAVNYDDIVTIVIRKKTEGDTYVDISTANSNPDGTYSILAPIKSGNVELSIKDNENYDIFETVKKDIKDSNMSNVDLKHLSEYKAYISYANEDNALTATAGADITFVKEFAKEMVDDVYTGKYSFTYKIGDGNDQKITISDTEGYGYDQEVKLSSTPPVGVAFVENAYIEGTIKMKDLPIIEATPDNIKLEYYKSTEPQETDLSNAKTEVANGVYRISFGNVDDFGGINGVKITFKKDVIGGSLEKTTEIIPLPTTKSITGKDIVLSETGYFLISGTVKNKNVGAEGVEISVVGTNVIGVKENKVTTGTGGKYALYAASNTLLNITPTNTNATFTPNLYEFTVIANRTLDFVMDSQELTSETGVSDAAGIPLKGVTVKYRVGETGTYSDAIFNDEDSTFTVNVRSDVTEEYIYVYFEKAGYTFNATSTTPACMTNGEFKANEMTYTITLKDADGTLIEDPSGISLQVAKYKRTSGPECYIYDLIGTKSDVTYDAKEKKFSFIAGRPGTETGGYVIPEVYGISVKSNSTEYTFEELTECNDDTIDILANERTITGHVTDAADEPLKGITVAIYDGEKKISKDATSLNDGSFSIISKDGVLKAVDSNGIYTFDDVDVEEPTASVVANEKGYNGTIKDMDGKFVKNANITVKVVDKAGKTVGSVATVDKDGKYKIITEDAIGNKIIVTDADGKRTFKEVEIIVDMPQEPESYFNIMSNQYTLNGAVERITNDQTPGLGIEGITVTLSIYSPTVDPVVVETAVTDKSGMVSFFVNDLGATTDSGPYYGIMATSSGAFVFDDENPEKFVDYSATISAEYITATGTVTDANATEKLPGIKVTAYFDDAVVGEYVTDENGEFEYPMYGEQTGPAGGMTFKAVDPNGVYTFDVSEDKDIVAKEKTFKVSVGALDGTPSVLQDASELIPLAGITVNFMKGDKVVKTAVTDADGMATAILAACDSCKAVDGNTKYGPMTFSTTTNENGGWKIIADQSIYSGYYAHGDNIPDVAVTFDMSLDGKFIDKGKAVVIDNEYFIVSAAEEANEINVMANAQGFYAEGTFDALEKIGTLDLKITEKPGIVNVNTEDVFFGKYYAIYNATNAQVGDKIVLRAQGVAYKPLEDGNETTVLKYTFDGWYVNGVKVSDDLEYVYTVTENCLVYADYKASTYETEPAPDNSISPSVLAIGIAAVIVALIAVVYTVMQKKE